MNTDPSSSDLPQEHLAPAALRVLLTIDKMVAIFYWSTVLKGQIGKKFRRSPEWMVGIENSIFDGSIMAMRSFNDFADPEWKPKWDPSKPDCDDMHCSHFPGLVMKTTKIPKDVRTVINKHLFHLTRKDLPANVAEVTAAPFLIELCQQAMKFCDYVVKSIPDEGTIRSHARTVYTVCRRVHDGLLKPKMATKYVRSGGAGR